MSSTNLENKYTEITFEQLLERWKAFHYLKLERGTMQTYERRLPHFDYLSKMLIQDITVSTIDDLISHWVNNCTKSKRRFSFKKEIDILKVVLNYYRRRINPQYLIPIFVDHYEASDIAKRPKTPVQALSADELSRFLLALRRGRIPMFYSMALAQVALGLRVGEVCGMNWPAIDLTNKLIRIDWTIFWDLYTWKPSIKERPKNGNVRILVIPDVLVDELGRLEQNRDPNIPLVFHADGTPINRQTIAKNFNRTLKKLGISHVHGTHFLRSTAATLANEATGDFFAVSKLLDHSNPSITLRYTKPLDSAKRKVAEALNSILNMAIKPVPAKVAG